MSVVYAEEVKRIYRTLRDWLETSDAKDKILQIYIELDSDIFVHWFLNSDYVPMGMMTDMSTYLTSMNQMFTKKYNINARLNTLLPTSLNDVGFVYAIQEALNNVIREFK